MAAPRAIRIELSETERAELQARLRRRKVARGDARRAEIALRGDLQRDSAAWERGGMAPSLLWRGERLSAALKLIQIHHTPGVEGIVTLHDVVDELLRDMPLPAKDPPQRLPG